MNNYIFVMKRDSDTMAVYYDDVERLLGLNWTFFQKEDSKIYLALKEFYKVMNNVK